MIPERFTNGIIPVILVHFTHLKLQVKLRALHYQTQYSTQQCHIFW